MKSLLLAAVLAAAPVVMPAIACAEQAQGAQMDHATHMAMTMAGGAAPREGGQAAFAAINEIVEMLAADPHTDWSKVNVEALRQHLIDMDNVTLRARVTVEDAPEGVRFLATGSGDTVGSIRRMTEAHAAVMNGVGGWTYAASEIPGGAALTVKVSGPADSRKVKALGYIGVMALGSHHQMHHLMIAQGRNPHP